MCKVCDDDGQERVCSTCRHRPRFDARVRLADGETVYANRNHGQLTVTVKTKTRVWREARLQEGSLVDWPVNMEAFL